ncbi:sugar ABC transporter permease [Halalkalibacterium halodurans]|jgi:glucose/mannose transport system permease protein|uniref:ABC transporter (Permease) n=2 Tax=Halalkalibacterium halodurans TaxID=86665 RepID=Q9K686_HALH5|nr:sugar ABC transporter permease [Halalkalibacterium halodurans]MDY7224350.1 sugar ABC transporter permease [Halalkalibacterium halodurans]MDY7243635.1 sugar ABC transporter permease [Halalkalibacterium halodurans]MED3647983.1 sugar ABC transporter permease [Halalkalibacterium halodurans]MED4079555.1 sugar ABC transporter permease [Halalkalibacterium halodurans]MED4084168.1 sugar ABC transporter permease [Halalkalibacterium halodurans]
METTQSKQQPLTAPATKEEQAPQQKRRRNKDQWYAILFLAPSILLIGVFIYGFIGWTGYVSLSNWNSLVPDFSFAGLKNYLFLFQDFRFQADLRNTLFFTILFIGAVIVLGQGIAILLDQKIRQESLFRNIFFFPMALSFVVTGVVWQWLLNPSTGVNLFLERFGLDSRWYTDTTIVPAISLGKIEFGLPVAMIAVVIAAVWQMTGFAVAMYLAGLRGIPDDVREAARMDGANEFQVYWKVILPLLRPITMSVIIIMAHISLKIFDLIFAMTGPGANFVTDVPGVYMFETTFRGNFYGQGSAIAIIMLVSVAIFIVPYLISSRKGESS